MEFSINLTRRVRKRKLLSGAVVQQTRYVLNYKDPKTGGRRQEFFETHKLALTRRSELILKVGSGTYVDEKTVPTVAEAVDHWLDDRAGNVKANTLTAHRFVVGHIRSRLGRLKVTDLTTADIRTWHRAVTDQVGAYTANRAKSLLKSILALSEEDYGVRAPSMPLGLGRGRQKVKKAILTPPDIARIIEAARADPEHGVYYAFPFLAGTRPSEQLGLLWEDVDFDANVIRIRRIQERDGSITPMTKTEAGTREVPMGPTLRGMLMEWRRSPPVGRGTIIPISSAAVCRHYSADAPRPIDHQSAVVSDDQRRGRRRAVPRKGPSCGRAPERLVARMRRGAARPPAPDEVRAGRPTPDRWSPAQRHRADQPDLDVCSRPRGGAATVAVAP